MNILVIAYTLVACAIAGYIVRIRLIDRVLRRRAAALPMAEAGKHHPPHHLRSAA